MAEKKINLVTAGGPDRPSAFSSEMTSEQDKTIAARVSAGMFVAGSKLEDGSLDSFDAASENPRHSRPINTSRNADERKSAKSLGDEEEKKEKLFNIDNESDLEARISLNRESVVMRGTVTPGVADAGFANFYLQLELEQ